MALRRDETFAIEAVAKAFDATWKSGENPPDAYLLMGEDIIAVEISTLAQYVTDDRGTRPRRSDDLTTAAFANGLDLELRHLIPDGYTIGLILHSPIADRRKTQAALAKKLRSWITDLTTFPSDQRIVLFGNTITPFVNHHGESGKYKKVSAIFMHRSAGRDVLATARDTLERCITTKTRKCAHLSGRIWLTLRDDYLLADLDTYRNALSCSDIPHPFEKILLIRRDGNVGSLV